MNQPLRNEIVEFLTPLLPYDRRQSILNETFWGENLQYININGHSDVFANRLFDEAYTFNKNAAIIAILETMRKYVGIDRQIEIDSFIQQLTQETFADFVPVIPESLEVKKPCKRRTTFILLLSVISIAILGILLIPTVFPPSADEAFLFLVDRSESMAIKVPEIGISRYEVAKNVISEVTGASRFGTDRWYGLTVFGGSNSDCQQITPLIDGSDTGIEPLNFASPLSSYQPENNSANLQALQYGFEAIPNNIANRKRVFLFLGSLQGSSNCQNDNITRIQLERFLTEYENVGITLQICVLTFLNSDSSEYQDLLELFGEEGCIYNIENENDFDRTVEDIRRILRNEIGITYTPAASFTASTTYTPTNTLTPSYTPSVTPQPTTQTPTLSPSNTLRPTSDNISMLTAISSSRTALAPTPEAEKTQPVESLLFVEATSIFTQLPEITPVSSVVQLTNARATSVDYSEVTSLVAVGSSEGIWLYNIDDLSLTPQRLGETHWIIAVAWKPDGTSLASVTNEGLIIIWDSIHKEKIIEFQEYMGDSIVARAKLVWSPDGQYLAASLGGILQVWDTNSSQDINVLRRRASDVQHLAWSPDSRQLVTDGEFDQLRIWDTITLEETILIKEHSQVVGIMWSYNGNEFIFMDYSSYGGLWSAGGPKLRIRRLTNGEELSRVLVSGIPSYGMSTILAPDEQLMLMISSGNARLINLTEETMVSVNLTRANDIVWMPDSTRYITTSSNGFEVRNVP